MKRHKLDITACTDPSLPLAGPRQTGDVAGHSPGQRGEQAGAGESGAAQEGPAVSGESGEGEEKVK